MNYMQTICNLPLTTRFVKAGCSQTDSLFLGEAKRRQEFLESKRICQKMTVKYDLRMIFKVWNFMHRPLYHINA
jgi:hypothetical protein